MQFEIKRRREKKEHNAFGGIRDRTKTRADCVLSSSATNG